MSFDRTKAAWAARKNLIADPAFAALLGTDVGTDVTHGKAYLDQSYADGWVFIGVTETRRPVRDPTSTGTSAVTLDMWGEEWGPPNLHNTAEFPTLRVIVWSDPTRPTNENGQLALRDAEDKCDRVRSAVIRALADPLSVHHDWGDGVKVGSCLLGTRLPLRDVPPYDGLVAGELRFNIEA